MPFGLPDMPVPGFGAVEEEEDPKDKKPVVDREAMTEDELLMFDINEKTNEVSWAAVGVVGARGSVLRAAAAAVRGASCSVTAVWGRRVMLDCTSWARRPR
jgi:hypothetical protein